MENCLIKQLKGSSINPALPMYNGTVLHFVASNITLNNQITGMFQGIPATEVEFSDGVNHFCKPNGDAIAPADIPANYQVSGSTVRLSPGDYYVALPNRYRLTIWRMGNAESTGWVNPCFYYDLEQLKYCNLFTDVTIDASTKRVTGDISNLAAAVNVTTLHLISTSLRGNVDELIRAYCLGGRTNTSNITFAANSSNVKYYSDYVGTEATATNVKKITFKSDFSGYQLRKNDNTLITAWKYDNGSWVHDDSVTS